MKYRILVAEDEYIERKMLCQTLEENLSDLCELLEAVNGEQALEQFKTHEPQIAILDIEMPGMSGLELARRIRASGKPCAILFLTGFDKFSYAKQAITVHAQDYLLKPYNEEELLSAVEEAIRAASRFPAEPLPERSGEAQPLQTEEGDLRLSVVRAQIRCCIEAHDAQDLSLQEIADEMGYSEGHFCRLFKQCFRVNFSAYLNEYRIEKAKEMMRDSHLSLKEIGMACGYSDAAYFCRVFKRLTGTTPSEYRMAQMGRTFETGEESLTES